jgi:hypothetical protein
MSDYDPNRVDPLRSDQPLESARAFNWNWIIGGIAALVVLIVALSFVGRDDRTAETGPRPATTGQASPTQSRTPNTPPTIPNAMPNDRAMERTAPPRPANPNQ